VVRDVSAGGRVAHRKIWTVAAAIVAVGLGAGLSGAILIKIQELVQAIAYGYLQAPSTDFYTEVVSASPLRRFAVLTLCGAVGGVGWVFIHRKGSPLLTVKQGVSREGAVMPFFTTAIHAILQTATVAMGSPLGKEAAPREMSAALTGLWLKRTSLFKDERMRKTLVACAAGAGLAAIYDAPLAGTLFTLETLLVAWGVGDAGLAAVACGIAVAFEHLVLGDSITYPVPTFDFDRWTMVFGLIIAPILAFAVVLFEKSKKRLPTLDRTSWKMVPRSICCFAGIGLIAAFLPLVLGNGQIGNDVSFIGQLDGAEGLMYFFAKWAAVLLACAAGAYGGNITPAMMMGGMLSLACAVAWNALGLPPVPLATAAFIGGAVYLGLAQKMPLTAAVFLVEITRCSAACFLPLCLAVGAACLCYRAFQSGTLYPRGKLSQRYEQQAATASAARATASV
jgi:H+/Cl- antiporter ClcA